jgi:hypothetical protein
MNSFSAIAVAGLGASSLGCSDDGRLRRLTGERGIDRNVVVLNHQTIVTRQAVQLFCTDDRRKSTAKVPRESGGHLNRRHILIAVLALGFGVL